MFKPNDLVRVISIGETKSIANIELVDCLPNLLNKIVKVTNTDNNRNLVMFESTEPWYHPISWWGLPPECLELVYESD